MTFMKALTIPTLCLLLFVPPLFAQEKNGAKTVKPTRGEAEVLRLPARTAPAEEAWLFSRATGIVKERCVDIGDRVKAGDVLAIIEAPEVIRQLEKARAGVGLATARADLARQALQRANSMKKDRVISAEALDERDADARVAEAELQSARAEVGRLEELEKFLTIRAPFDGRVAGRKSDRGDLIQGDQSGEDRWMFHLVRLNELRVVVNAPPSAALRLQIGQTASVEFAEIPARKFDATVARSSGVIDTTSGTMRVELLLPNGDLILPAGLTGLATLTAGEKNATLRIPTNALVTRDGTSKVARVVNGTVAFSAVKLGRNLGSTVEILEGVSAEDSLLVSPNALLREGEKIAQ